MRRILLLLTATMLVAVMMAVTAAPAFAALGKPAIGGSPPGTVERNFQAGENPSVDNRTEPRTGGIKFAESCDKPATFC
jgi:hypothetical protein